MQAGTRRGRGDDPPPRFFDCSIPRSLSVMATCYPSSLGGVFQTRERDYMTAVTPTARVVQFRTKLEGFASAQRCICTNSGPALQKPQAPLQLPQLPLTAVTPGNGVRGYFGPRKGGPTTREVSTPLPSLVEVGVRRQDRGSLGPHLSVLFQLCTTRSRLASPI